MKAKQSLLHPAYALSLERNPKWLSWQVQTRFRISACGRSEPMKLLDEASRCSCWHRPQLRGRSLQTGMPAATSGRVRNRPRLGRSARLTVRMRARSGRQDHGTMGFGKQRDMRRDAKRHRDCPNASRRVASRWTDQEGDGVRH